MFPKKNKGNYFVVALDLEAASMVASIVGEVKNEEEQADKRSVIT